MVYATCSILRWRRMKKQIRNFLKNNLGPTLIREEAIMPSAGYDGFYIALIEKK